MNKRIRELVLKATGNNPSFDEFGIILGEEDIEKVAKLIIRECANIVDSDDTSYPYNSFGDKIENHFEVK